MNYRRPLGMRRHAAFAVALLACCIAASTFAVAANAAAVAVNGSCPRVGATTKLGTRSLACTKVGTKNQWRVSTATTVAPATTSAATTAPVATTPATTRVAAVAPATSTPVPPAPADMDANGILKVAMSIDLTGGLAFDPIRSVTISDEPWILTIYGALMRSNADGGFDEWFAKTVDIVDPKTVKVTLNSGIVFSDGTPYDAAAVQAGMMRNLNTPFAAAKAGQNSIFKETASITVDGPLALTIKLQTPVAGEYLAVLAGREAAVPSPKAIAAGIDLNRTPVGAGPYVLSDHKPAQILSIRKSPTFFQKERWRLAGFDFLHAQTSSVAVSGLLAGTANYSVVDPVDAGKVESAGRYGMNVKYTDFSYVIMNFCSTKPPFNDVRVRQAVQLALDKNQMNQFVLRGRGKVGYGFWADDSPNFNEKLRTLTAQDLPRAKKLMADAGISNVTVDLAYPSPVNYVALSELIQSQLEPIGIKLNITPYRDIVTDFITPQKAGIMIVPGSRSGVDKINKVFQPGNQQVLCNQPRNDLAALAEQVAGLKPGDPKAIELWKQIDQVNAENAYMVFLYNQPRIEAYNKNEVGGNPPFVPTKSTPPYQNFELVYMRK